MKKRMFNLITIFILTLFGWNSVKADDSGFTGQLNDPNSQAIFLRSRFYEPETGVYWSKDRTGINGGLNQYTYAYSNPVNHADPDGQFAPLITGAIGAGVGALIAGGVTYYETGDIRKAGGAAALGAVGGFAVGSGGALIAGLATGSLEAYAFLSTATAAVASAPELGGTGVVLGGAATASSKFAYDSGILKPVGDIVDSVGAQISDSSLVHFSTQELSVVNPGVGGNLYAFQYGQIKNLTASQIEGVIGSMAKSGQQGASQFMHVIDGTAESATSTEVNVDPFKEYVFESPQSVSQAVQVQDATRFNLFGGGANSSSAITSTALGSILSDGNNSSNFGVGGVLINKAATLVSGNLADIKGASYDPATKQIVFLGTNQNGAALTTPLNMDYFYTAIQSVYGSATPPFVTLDPPATPYTQWPFSQTFTTGSTQGYVLRYNPLWSNEDTTISLRFLMHDASGNHYDFTYVLNAYPLGIFAGNREAMGLAYSTTTGTVPPGVSLNTEPFQQGVIEGDLSLSGQGQDSYWPVQLTNGGTGNLIVDGAQVIPARQHREYGGRVDGTRLGWVMYEADRVMKCLGVGKDNLTGAIYSSATLNVPGYQNLLERATASGSAGNFSRMWFEPNQMTLQSYIDPVSGKATIGFSQSSVQLLTEAFLQGIPADPNANAFATQFTQNYDNFAALNFPVMDPTDATGKTIINVPIFALLKQAMQAVSLARFFHDNNIPLDKWWMSSYQPPVAYSPKSIPTATNTNATATYTIYGGVQITKPNTYVPSSTAQALAQNVASARPAPQPTDPQDVPGQVWNASDPTFGNLTAVSASLAHAPQDGNVKLGGADLAFPSSGGLPLAFHRYYQSSWLGTGTMGIGWKNTRYVLQFTAPSWYDQHHLMVDAGGNTVVTTNAGDTQLRSGTVRVVDQSTGSYLDFTSSLSLSYSLNAQGNPQQTITGLTTSDLPTFTPGQHQSGATLIQNAAYNYVATLTDGSSITFDSNGNLLQSLDRHNHSLTYSYDTSSRLNTISDDMKPPQVITLTYDPTSGLLTSATGPNGTQTSYKYDSTNTLLTTVVFKRSSSSTSTYPVAQYTYNSSNQLVDVTNLSGLKPVSHAADIKGRSSNRKDVRGNTSNFTYTQAADNSRMTSVLDPNSGLGAAQKKSDAQGRTMAVTDTLGHTTSYGYNGSSLYPNSVQSPTPNRPAIQIARDTYGKPTQLTDPANVGAQPILVSYDPTTQLPTQVTDEMGRAAQVDYTPTKNVQKLRVYHNGQKVETTLGYDSNDRLNAVTDPMGNTSTITRDAVGRVLSQTDPTGVSVSYDYDSLGRLAHIHVPTTSVPVTYQYDDLDRVTSVSNALGTTTYAYDPVTTWLNSTATTNTSGQTIQTLAYTYDNSTGDVKTTTATGYDTKGTPTSTTTSANYTAYGNIQSVTPQGAQPINFNYNAAGQLLGTSETDSGPAVGPTIIANNATSGQWTNQNTQFFNWSITQSSLPITGYNVAQDGTSAQTVNNTSATLTWNTVSDGKHVLTVAGVDSSNKWSPASTFNLWVDTTPPVISQVTLAPLPIPVPSSATLTLSANVTDTGSGLGTNIPQVRWCISSDATRNWTLLPLVPGAGTTWSGNFTSNWGQSGGATLYYQVLAQDVAGNQTISPEVGVPIANNSFPFFFFNH